MEEGSIFVRRGKLFPYRYYDGGLFAYNNYYGATVRTAFGGPEPTAVGDDPIKDIIELNIVGLSVRPEDLKSMYSNMVVHLYDKLDEKDYQSVLEKIAEMRTEPSAAGVNPIAKYNKEKGVFECLNALEAAKIMCDLQEMPPRTPTKKPPLKIISILHADKRKMYYPERYQD